MAQGPMSSILVTIRNTIRIQEFEVRNPHSLDYWRSYQQILMKFYRELWCGLETNWLHFADDPDHHPDPGVQSPKSGFTGLSIMLAFGGGLRSLSTSSLNLLHRTSQQLQSVALLKRDWTKTTLWCHPDIYCCLMVCRPLDTDFHSSRQL